VYEQLKTHIAHVHLSNFDGREHRLPPDGRLPLDRLLHQMAEDGFQGAISVECGPGVFEAHDEARCRAGLRRVVDFCRQHFA
jgi:sugar phosphate isomerase/epimerase